VVNLQPGLAVPAGSSFRQFFGGVSKSFGRGDLLAVGDYLELGGSERTTLTISYTIPLNRGGGSKR
jgi:hypothetical protein